MGTSQTCRGCRGNWKLRSLEAWKLGLLAGAPPHVLVVLRRPLAGAPVSPESPASPVGRAHGHVADVPGMQGQLEAWKFRGLEAWPPCWRSAPRPRRSPSPACGRSCISCISCWSSQSYLGKLPAKTPVCFLLHDAVGPIGHIGPLGRRLTPLYTTSTQRLTVAPQGRSVLRSLFSVLWGGNAAPWFFVLFVFSPKHSTLSHQPHPSRTCRAFCSLFTVLCSLGRQCRPSVLRGAPAPPAPLPKTGHSPPLNPNNPTTHHTIRHPQNLSLGSPFSPRLTPPAQSHIPLH